MPIRLFLFLFASAVVSSGAMPPGYELRPELEVSFLAADGGRALRERALDDLSNRFGGELGGMESSSGASELAFRGGLSVAKMLGGRLAMHAGTHVGNGIAEIHGDATRESSIRETKVELGYLLVDWQVGAEYRFFKSLSAFATISLERGFLGSYRWIGYGRETIAEGDAGEAGPQGRIDLPWRTIVRLGTTWRLLDRVDVSPWISLGPARIVAEDSYLVDPRTGGRLPMDDEASFMKGKAGLRLGYAL